VVEQHIKVRLAVQKMPEDALLFGRGVGGKGGAEIFGIMLAYAFAVFGVVLLVATVLHACI